MTRQYLVIGGTKGIGFHLTRRLLKQGHAVVAASRTPCDAEGFDNLAQGKLTLVAWDATKGEDFPQSVLPEALHGLAYLPGNIRLKPFRSLRRAELIEDFELNVLGAFQLIKQVFYRLNAGEGSCVFFSTVAVGQGMPFHVSTATVKAALEGMTRSLAAEFASSGVRFNAIAPSLTDTPLAATILSNEKRRQHIAERNPMEKIGDPDQIAAMAQHLLSPDAAWITGQVIGIDGGMSTLRS